MYYCNYDKYHVFKRPTTDSCMHSKCTLKCDSTYIVRLDTIAQERTRTCPHPNAQYDSRMPDIHLMYIITVSNDTYIVPLNFKALHNDQSLYADLSSFDEQEMHSSVRQDDEDGSKNTQIPDVRPHGIIVESKGAEDGRARHRDIQSVLAVHEGKLKNLIDNKRLEAVVENRQRLEPKSTLRSGIVVQEEASEKKTKKHDQAANQVRDTAILANNSNKETNSRSSHVEEYQHQYKVEEVR